MPSSTQRSVYLYELASLAGYTDAAKRPKTIEVRSGEFKTPEGNLETLISAINSPFAYAGPEHSITFGAGDAESLIAYELLCRHDSKALVHDWEFVRKAAALPDALPLNPENRKPLTLLQLAELRDRLRAEIAGRLRRLAKLVTKVRVQRHLPAR